MDRVFGLDFDKISEESQKVEVPEFVEKLAQQRFEARKQKNWAESDRLRGEIENAGFAVKDKADGYELVKK